MPTSPRLRRAAVSIQVPVQMVADPGAGWEAGPFPNRWRDGTPRVVVGDRVGRRRYLNEGLDTVLYTRRWHTTRKLDAPQEIAEIVDVVAGEVLGLPSTSPRPDGILVLHILIDSTADVLHVVNYLANHNPAHGGPMRDWLAATVDPFARLSSLHRRAQHVSLVTSDSTAMPDTPLVTIAEDVDGVNVWLASLEASGRYGPDIGMLGSAGTYVAMSNHVRGLVGRGGISLVGLVPDDGDLTGEQGFKYDGLIFFAQGLYTDALLFGNLQRIMIDELRDGLESLRKQPRLAKGKLQDLERALVDFRNDFWRTDFAPQGSQDEFLMAYQSEHALIPRLAEFSAQLAEYSAQVQRAEQEKTNALIAFTALVAFPITAALTIWTGIHDAGIAWFIALVGAAILFAALAVTAFPGGRAILKSLFLGPKA